MALDTRAALEKMRKHCENAMKYARGLTYDEFIHNELYLTFAVFSLSQLGELASVLSARTDCGIRYPKLPWVAMRSMRNHIVHDYDGLLLSNIWATLQEDIPALQEQLVSILQAMDKGQGAGDTLLRPDA